MQALIAHRAAAMSAKRAYLLIIDCASSELSNWINSSKQWQVVQDSWIWRTYWILLACDTSLPLIAFTDVARPSLLSTQSTSREGLKDFFKFLSHEVFMKFSCYFSLFDAKSQQGLLCVSLESEIASLSDKRKNSASRHPAALRRRWGELFRSLHSYTWLHWITMIYNDHQWSHLHLRHDSGFESCTQLVRKVKWKVPLRRIWRRSHASLLQLPAPWELHVVTAPLPSLAGSYMAATWHTVGHEWRHQDPS